MTQLTQTDDMAQRVLEVLVSGNLSVLTAPQRVDYYNRLCDSLKLNPLTKPFEFITLNGKLVLYALKGATDQLRQIHGVSVSEPHVEQVGDMYIVKVSAQDKTGRTDSDMGVVAIAGLRGEALANAMLKAVTKAKRRVTLSICGLGMLDETEIEDIPESAKRPPVVMPQARMAPTVTPTIEAPKRRVSQGPPFGSEDEGPGPSGHAADPVAAFWAWTRAAKWDRAEVLSIAGVETLADYDEQALADLRDNLVGRRAGQAALV